MSTNPSSSPRTRKTAAAEGATERVEAISYLDEHVRRDATPVVPASTPREIEPGRYLEVKGSGESLLVRLEREITRIGRGLAADLRLDENSVSRRHAMVINDPAGARILDDRSSNGTYVNGARVEQAALAHGDELMLGRVSLRYLEV